VWTGLKLAGRLGWRANSLIGTSSKLARLVLAKGLFPTQVAPEIPDPQRRFVRFPSNTLEPPPCVHSTLSFRGSALVHCSMTRILKRPSTFILLALDPPRLSELEPF
jgi:hypothetical protein